MKKKLLFLITILVLSISVTGCKQDDMEDIEIAVTNYPNEYIVDKLYGKHSTINRVYPDDVDISAYKVTKKQKENFSKMELFIYTGLVEQERVLAVSLLALNNDLKIIDTSYVLETDYSNEELWLNPNSLLMMAQNVRLGLKEYVTSTYLSKDIDKQYNKLKVELSELDASYRVAVENTEEKNIIVQNRSLKFLEKFGLNVYVLDSETTDKELAEISNLINNTSTDYIFKYKKEENNKVCDEFIKNHSNAKILELNRLDNITDKDRDDGKDYITLMNENLDILKQELYQ